MGATNASRLPWCFDSRLNASSYLSASASTVPHSTCTIPFSPSFSTRLSTVLNASVALPEVYRARARTDARSGDEAAEAESEESTAEDWPRAI